MSSSLFHDCYAPYDCYPYTEYIEGDKTFGEVGIGGILYCLHKDNEMTELEVKNPFHVTRGRCYITVNGRGNNIDFGPNNCANVLGARHNSIIYHNVCIIGTERDTVINVRCKQIEEQISEAEKKYKQWTKELEKVKSLLVENI